MHPHACVCPVTQLGDPPQVNRPVRIAFVALPSLALAATCAAQLSAVDAHPRIRILNRVDSSQTHVLRGTHPQITNRATIGQRVKSSTRLDKMILVLAPSDQQNAALHTLLDAQQDKGSPLYHKWLTPDAFASKFGVAESDAATVSRWLTDNGMSVEATSKSGYYITFSGTVGSVEAAFHTELHHLTVNGQAHISNTTDVSIPMALANVVRGVKSLNDFKPQTTTSNWRSIQLQKNADGSFNSFDPQYGSSSTGTHYIGAGDLATIYNATPLQKAGNTGKGVSIAVLGRTNIQLSDVDTYRALFGLSKNTPNVTVVGSDPGQNADDIEAFLDAEMAGSLATDASVNFIVGGPSLVSSGIDSAGLYAVDNNIGDIISLSYGGCETNDGASGTAFWSQLWEQAAAQGQSAFVSSGDSGAAGCDSSSATVATKGYGVNALSASPYAVSVGGTMFVDFNPAKYWGASTTIPYSTALGYIPEAALNQSLLTTTLLNSTSTSTVAGSGIFAGGGGISIYEERPAWQHGSGIPNSSDAIAVYSGSGIAPGSPITGLHRLQPDVSFISANGHDGTLFCAEGSCYQTNTGGLASAGIVGGTSVAAPALASAQALINAANGGRQGNPNINFYALADRQFTASTTACQSQTGTASAPATTLPASSCYFQDTIAGSNIVPTATTGGAGIGFSAQAGYDEASGLGSPNIANLARDWKTVTFNATSTTLALSPTTGKHGATQTVTVQVTPASGSGTPTGDVALIASQTSGFGSPITLTLSSGNATAAINSLPAGSYTVVAHYAGDTTFGASTSLPVNVTIAKEDSITSVAPYSVLASGALAQTTRFTYGAAEIYVDTEVAGQSGAGTASGTVNFTVVGNGQTLAPLTTQLDTYGTTYLISGPALSRFYLTPNYPTLSPGSYTLTVNYAGDVSFNSSVATTSFVISRATPAVSFTSSTASITAGSTTTLNYTITTPAAATPATGSVNFTDSISGASIGTVQLVNGAAVLNTGAITAPGTHTITAVYSGDTNYTGATSTTTVTVQSTVDTTTTLTPPGGTLSVGSTVGLTARVIASTTPVVGGTVSFYDGGVLLGTSNLVSGGVASLSVTTFNAGPHTLSAKYSGIASSGTTSGFNASTSAPVTVPINQGATAMRVGGPNYAPLGSAVALEGAFTRTPSTTAAPAVAPTGRIYFYDGGSTGGTLLGSATPVFGVGGYATYEATLSISTLAIGPHSIVAYYPGDANYTSSISVAKPLTIVQASIAVPSVTITSGTASTTLTALVSTDGGTVAPTGSVTFTVDNGVTVTATCTASSAGRSCTASYPTGSLAVGTHTITATETGDAIFSLLSGTGTLIVTGGQPSVGTTSTISRAGDGNYLVTVTVTNTGNGPAQAVTITGITIGSVAGSPAPQPLGNIPSGASATATFEVPALAGAPGANVVERVSGTYTGGTFAGNFRTRLPN